MTSRALNNAIKLSGLASTDTYAFSSVTTDTLSSSKAKSAFLSGNFTITNTQSKAGFGNILYTGQTAQNPTADGSTITTGTTSLTVNCGIDLDTQWGTDTSERYGGLVWVKNRDQADSHVLNDTVRGTTNLLRTDTTDYDLAGQTTVTSYNTNGVSIGAHPYMNTSGEDYIAWIFQTTHRVSGTTNHGKAYTSHYNPYTGFTIVRYEGSGVAGHEIPHHLGRKLDFVTIKGLDDTYNWKTGFLSRTDGTLTLNLSESFLTLHPTYMDFTDIHTTLPAVISGANQNNIDTYKYILYGWANSYYDDAGELNGNYEIGTYQGTGVTGNKITTRGKPAWVMVKRMDTTGQWWINDNQRGDSLRLFAESSSTESSSTSMAKNEDGFTLTDNNSNLNASGGQYLYVVVYDNDSASGKSNYTKSLETSALQVTNGVVSYSHGVNTTGAVNSIENIGTSTLSNISWDI